MHRIRALDLRRFWRAFMALALLSGAVAIAGRADAVHDANVFELDGNATTGTHPGLPDDWDRIVNDTATGPTAKTFTTDPAGATIFTGGGSKDNNDISSWKWKSATAADRIPDKDDLLHAYAARYSAEIDSGHTGPETLLYFGADRFDNSGDAQIGFWFLQGEVAPQGNPGSGSSFGPDAHEVGDVLVLSDFTGGGVAPTITVYEWVGTGGDAKGGTLKSLSPIGGSADCGIIADDDDFCAIVNPADGTFAPWAFLNKDGQNSFGASEFFEGGINLSAFPALDGECFASFITETRSSASVDAVLKDFVHGSFQACEASINTTPSAQSIVLGQTITDTAVVTGEAAGGTPSGNVVFHVCGPTTPPAFPTCSSDGFLVGLATGVALVGGTATSESFTPPAIGNYCFRGDYVPAAGSPYAAVSDFDSSECFSVTDIASTTTAQKWLPQDTATVTSAGGSAIAGTVTFSLYENNNCSGTAVQTFGPVTVVNGVATTDNTTYYTTGTTVSWRAVFTSSNENEVASGPPAACETSTLTITNEPAA